MINIKAAYMAKAELAFDSGIEELRQVYNRHLEDVTTLVEFWDEITWDMTYLPANVKVPAELVYDYPSRENILDALWFIKFFVSHELHDDGEPALVYLKQDLTGVPNLKEALGQDQQEVRAAMDARRQAPWVSVPVGHPDACPVLLRTRDPYATKQFGVEYPDAIFLSDMGPLKTAAEQVREMCRQLRERFRDEPRGPSEMKQKLEAILRGVS
jgi:hypothetical protein